MTPATKRALFWVPPAAVLALAMAWLFRPDAVPVDLAAAERGPLTVAVSDEYGRSVSQEAWLVLLVKPQFEVGRERVGKGGIVRDEAARQEALEQVAACARALGLVELGRVPSPITGADGNVEFLLGLRAP